MWLFYIYHAFSGADHTGQVLIAVNTAAAAVSALNGRFQYGYLSTAATDLAGGKLT